MNIERTHRAAWIGLGVIVLLGLVAGLAMSGGMMGRAPLFGYAARPFTGVGGPWLWGIGLLGLFIRLVLWGGLIALVVSVFRGAGRQVADGSIQVGALRLHYQEWRPPDAEVAAGTIVLVHGLGSSSHIWDLTAPLLAAHSFRVVAPDQRGHGESDQPTSGYDFASVVADLGGFMDAVGIVEPAVLVGHSWGASVVLQAGVLYPDRTAGIVLVDGGTGSPGERWTWEETTARLTPPDIDGMLWDDLLQRISNTNGAYVDPRAQAVGRSLFHVDDTGRVSRRFRIPNHMRVVRALWEQRPAELLPRLKCPLLILPARQASDAPEARLSKLANVERALALQPLARVRWFEDTVHDVPLQRPDELAGEVLTFAEQSAVHG